METLPLWKAIFLGALQGATEFLPVSSSAHLVIAQQFLNMGTNGAMLFAFDVALHFGTLLAVILFFWRDLIWMLRSGEGRRLAFLLALATLPAVVIGLSFKAKIEALFTSVAASAGFLLVTGCLLWLTRWAKPAATPLEKIGIKQALGIGVTQAVAILPGISRSGSTIAAGLFLGLAPQAAVRFSFLLSIIAIAGANVLEAKAFSESAQIFSPPFLVGMLAAFAVGYAAIRWMLKIVARGKLHHFAWYCWGMGGLVILLSLCNFFVFG